jgi:hypothetical protein
MANERIVSPGVFTRERDLSFLTQGIGEIGGAFIGPTPKGPAFIPTIVRSQQEYVNRFGEADVNHYTGLTVKNYLREAGVATIVRVLGLEGYDATAAQSVLIYATGSAGRKLYAVLHPTSTGVSLTNATAAGTTSSFSLTVTSSAGTSISSSGFSPTEGNGNYFGDYFTKQTVQSGSQGAKNSYIYGLFPSAVTASLGTNISFFATTSSTALNLSGSTYGKYSNARTPWIQSQKVGNANVNLFKVYTLSDGVSSNNEIKVSFLNMKPSTITEDPYGTFSMVIRKFTDTDARQEVLEQYDNLTLNPDSPQYIARVVGNSVPTEDPVTNEMYYQGDFPNTSQYVYVEMTDAPIPETALPFGFDSYESTISVSSAELVSPSLVTTRWINPTTNLTGYTTESVDKRYYYGWNFDSSNDTNLSYLGPIPSGSVSIPNSSFNLETVIDVPNGTSAIPVNVTGSIDSFVYRKFSVAFQGGFDGLNPARDINMGGDIVASNTQGFNLSTSVSAGSKAYKKALTAISNPDQFDFNLLVLPGVIYSLHSYVANEALSLCEDRGDAFYIMDTVALSDNVTTAVNKANEIDSNYAATYYPWLRVIDTNTNKLLWVPPSVILPEIYAYNDNVAAEWFAPAGLNRGGIASAVGVKVRLPQTTRDTLYEGKVNPIAQFPGQGICVWGQKTLQRRKSALDRVNVRRLLIAVKKFIASASRYLVFEQNVEATRNRFLNIVNPYLASVQERSGLYAFRVVMDETNNTPDVIDRNILYGQLYLQPTKTAEFIILDFNVLPTGAVFPTA